MKAGDSFVIKQALATAALTLVLTCGCEKKPAKEEASASRPAQSGSKVAKGPVSPMNRMDWNLQTLVDNYRLSGHHDPAWDESATNALVKFALIRSDGDRTPGDDKILGDYCRTAVLQGCQDPVILYLHTRNVIGFQEGATDQMMADGYKKAIAALREYRCAPIRQAYMALRAAQSVNSATGNKGNVPEIHHFRRGCLESLLEAMQDPGIPPIEVYEITKELLAAVKTNPQQHSEFFTRLEPLMDQNWSDNAFIQLLKGRYHIDEAWRLRGSGYSDKVTDDGWKGFSEQLLTAETALEKGWKLDPTNVEFPYEMLSVELGQGKGRARMEQWFERAMKLNTNGAGICKRKLRYLEPKWHGSAAEMLKFARECAASEDWGSEVLLMPLHAHESLAGYAKREGNTNYWKSPAIWREIKSALDRYYSRYPDDVSWRHNYAMHAYRAEDWNEFNKQVVLFVAGTNFDYFGGRDAFERMAQNAHQRAAAK